MISRLIEFLGAFFAMVLVTLILGVVVWYWLKAVDAVRAFFYNRKHNRCECPTCAPHLWAERPAIYITVDRPRPKRYWAGMTEDEICAELEGSV